MTFCLTNKGGIKLRYINADRSLVINTGGSCEVLERLGFKPEMAYEREGKKKIAMEKYHTYLASLS